MSHIHRFLVENRRLGEFVQVAISTSRRKRGALASMYKSPSSRKQLGALTNLYQPPSSLFGLSMALWKVAQFTLSLHLKASGFSFCLLHVSADDAPLKANSIRENIVSFLL